MRRRNKIVANTRSVYAASRTALRFGDLYDSGDYEFQRDVYDKMDDIFDKYHSPNDSVVELFDQATPEEQRQLMKLAEDAQGDELRIFIDLRFPRDRNPTKLFHDIESYLADLGYEVEDSGILYD